MFVYAPSVLRIGKATKHGGESGANLKTGQWWGLLQRKPDSVPAVPLNPEEEGRVRGTAGAYSAKGNLGRKR